MTEHVSIFDKSQEKEGVYLMTTKTGARYAYSKRTEVWKDKASAQHVTLELLRLKNIHPHISDFINNNGYIAHLSFPNDTGTAKKVDVRYNDVSTVLEIET